MGEIIVAHDISHGLKANQKIWADGLRRRVTIKKADRSTKRPKNAGEWQSKDANVRAEFKGSGKSYSIALKSNDAARFGRFIAENFERLHAEFMKSEKTEGR